MARASNPAQHNDRLVLDDETDDLWEAALGSRAGDRLETLVAIFDVYEAALFPMAGQPSLAAQRRVRRESKLDFA